MSDWLCQSRVMSDVFHVFALMSCRDAGHDSSVTVKVDVRSFRYYANKQGTLFSTVMMEVFKLTPCQKGPPMWCSLSKNYEQNSFALFLRGTFTYVRCQIDQTPVE